MSDSGSQVSSFEKNNTSLVLSAMGDLLQRND